MKKAKAIEMWSGLEPNQGIMRHMIPLSYTSTGSTYGSCGVRIDGTPDFVNAVLSHLKEMLSGENDETRLALSYNEVDGSKLEKSFENKAAGAVCCYIRLHERGNESKILNAKISALRARNAGR